MGGFSSSAPAQAAAATPEMIRQAQLKAAESLSATKPGVPVNMNPDDWFCSICTTHNYAARNRCFRCRQGVNPGRGAGFALRGQQLQNMNAMPGNPLKGITGIGPPPEILKALPPPPQ